MIKVRLFWKIFFAFWAGSLLVVIATSSLIGYMASSDQAKERHKKIVDEISHFIIQQHERGLPLHPKPEFHRKPAHKKIASNSREAHSSNLNRHRRSGRFFPIQIFKGDNLIYQNKPITAPNKLQPFGSITSTNGNTYRILSSRPQIQRFVMGALKILTTLQLVLIFICSGIVSLLLSWTITRPLKQLSLFSQQVTDSDHDPKLPPKLLSRSDEIGDLANHISTMLNTIQQQFQEQQHLLHHVSHEIRAPLARLQAVTALLEQQPNKIDTYGAHIHEECEHIDHLLQRILDFSRLEQNCVEASDFDLVSAVSKQIQKLHLEDKNRQVVFEPRFQSLILNGFEELIECAIANILRNAHKYSPRNNPIEITVKALDHSCKLTIRDHGKGINEEESDRLTKAFYREDNTIHTDGFGLGLSITQRIVKKHKGKLSFNNHIAGGLIVTVELPTH